MNLNPKIWGPYYWFVLYTMAISYPTSPNDVTKKKYYDFIQNFPLFIPSSDIGNTFSVFIDKYPVTPYLDTRESFIKWVHFIHNKFNVYLGKNEISYYEAMKLYYNHYEEKTIKVTNEKKHKHKYIFASIIFILILTIIIMYKL